MLSASATQGSHNKDFQTELRPKRITVLRSTFSDIREDVATFFQKKMKKNISLKVPEEDIQSTKILGKLG